MSLITNKKKSKISVLTFKALQNGSMPSVFDIKRWIKRNEASYPSNHPAKFTSFYTNGGRLNPATINKFIDEYKFDLQAISQTIEDGWNELDFIINKAISFSQIYDSSSVLSKSVRGTLSRFNDADEFFTLNILGTGIDSGSWDLSISENILLDSASNSITLEKSSTAMINKELLSVSSTKFYSENNSQLEVGELFGEPDYIFDGNIANRMVSYVYTNDNDSRISQEIIINLSESDSIDIVNYVEIFSSSISDLEVVVDTNYDGYNWQRLGEFFGNGKLIVSGTPRRAKSMKITLTKRRSDMLINGKQAYVFDIGEVIVFRNTFAKEGYVISDTIDNDSEIVSASIDFDGAYEDKVKFFISNDVSEPSGKNDFSWVEITKDMNWLSRPTEKLETVEISTPSKYFYGPGSTFDIYQIGKTDGILSSVDEGYNQMEIRYLTVAYSTKPIVSRQDFSISTLYKYTNGVGTIILKPSGADSMPNYFHASTKIYSDFNESAEFSVNIPFSKFKIYVNTREITNSVRNGAISLPLSVGENFIEIVVLRDESSEGTEFVFSPRGNPRIAVSRLEISTQDSMASLTPKACVHDGNIIVNRYTKDKAYRIFTKHKNSIMSDSVRIMAELKQGEDGEVPSIKQVVLRTGA